MPKVDAAGRYYVQMGLAWALATFYLEFPDEVFHILATHTDSAVRRMAVRKAVRIAARARPGKSTGETNCKGAQRHMTEFTRRIYEVVKQIPKGCVASYGQVAQWPATRAGARRGFALHRNPEPGVIPCHRVVFQDGSTCTGLCLRRARSAAPPSGGRGRHFSAGRPCDMAACRWL